MTLFKLTNIILLSGRIFGFQTPQYSPEHFGSLICLEPGHRFLSSIQHKLDHNGDYPNQPEEWICKWCDHKLMMLVQRICCGVEIRKRREAEEIDFWHRSSYQSHKLQSKHENGVMLHPDMVMKNQRAEDCFDDLVNKQVRVSRSTTDDGNNNAITNDDSTNNQNQEFINQKSDLTSDFLLPKTRNIRGQRDKILYENSLKNGGKGRTQVGESKIEEITCHKESANSFLETGGTGALAAHSTPDRKIYKHTYLQRECCGINGWTKGKNGKPVTKDSCGLEEVQQHYLQEECCGEGCRLEEIYEGCGAWRWDMKEKYEEKL